MPGVYSGGLGAARCDGAERGSQISRRRRVVAGFSPAVLAALLAFPAALHAHGEAPAGPWDVWNHWSVRAGTIAPLLLVTAGYVRGLRQVWRRGGTGRQISRARAAAFFAGMMLLGVALLSPLDPLGGVLFSAHMVQHLMLILAAAPLLVAGAPETALLWALPSRGRRWMGRCFAWYARLAECDAAPAGPLLTVVFATIVLWAWHIPRLYDLAVTHETVHALEHGAFLTTALLFWATVLRVRPRARRANGLRVLLVFAMALQGTALGALITFASRPLYASHASIPDAWHLDPLMDQQLAGLIMWVPPALLYVGVTVWLFVRWLESIERRSLQHEQR